jgi:hypothetical protein
LDHWPLVVPGVESPLQWEPRKNPVTQDIEAGPPAGSQAAWHPRGAPSMEVTLFTAAISLWCHLGQHFRLWVGWACLRERKVTLCRA